jgi:hypothetical protein
LADYSKLRTESEALKSKLTNLEEAAAAAGSATTSSIKDVDDSLVMEEGVEVSIEQRENNCN